MSGGGGGGGRGEGPKPLLSCSGAAFSDGVRVLALCFVEPVLRRNSLLGNIWFNGAKSEKSLRMRRCPKYGHLRTSAREWPQAMFELALTLNLWVPIMYTAGCIRRARGPIWLKLLIETCIEQRKTSINPSGSENVVSL